MSNMVTTNGDFAVSATSTCPPNTPIAVKKTCVINVTFTPKDVGTRFGGLIITDDDGGVATSQQVVALMGTGVAAQTPQSGTAQPQTVTGLAGNQGIPLKTDLTVKGNVSVQAVLIPYEIGRRVFGREIAKNYAIVQLTINNRSPDAALIIQGAFIDYHEWALAGLTQPQPNSQQTTCVEGTEQEVIKDTATQSPNQACTIPSQVASVEARVARGQLLDFRPWTARNLIVNGLTFVGSVASAYAFSIKQQGYIRGIAAFNGNVVPGVGVLFPDGTVGQLNNISDFGYQTNKVIPKQASDIIVCFFPIDRFLTPGFKKIFLNEPALLLSPYQILLDPKSRSLRHASGIPDEILKDLGIDDTERKKLAGDLPCFLALSMPPNPASDATPLQGAIETFGLSCKKLDGTDGIPTAKDLALLVAIGKVSLNSIRVVVDGIMTVETGAIPAQISSVDFADGNSNPTVWTTAGVKKVTIKGQYLTGGTIKITEAADLGITAISMIADGSTDKALNFSITTSKPIPSGQELTFTVTKTDPKDATKVIISMSYILKASYVLGSPTITGAVYKDGKITVTGTNLVGNTLAPLSVKLHPPGGGSDTTVTPATTSTDKEIDITPSPVLTDAGCWDVLVAVGTMSAPSGKNSFAVLPVPAIKTATRAKPPATAVVTGSGFVDTKTCGGSTIAFEVVEDKSGVVPIPVTATIDKAATTATLKLPTAAQTGSDWKVQVLLDKTVKDTAALK